MAKSSPIPRFLLPRITWHAPLPRRPGITSHISTPHSYQGLLRKPAYRAISSTVQPWNSSNSIPSNPQSPPLHRPRSCSPPRKQHVALSSAFRILSQKPFSTTSFLFRDHHFDTLKFVQRLKDEGFSEEQSKAMMLVLSDVIEESIQNLTRTMVLREDADRSTYTQKVDFTKLRSELLALDSSDNSMILASHERLSNDIAKLNSRLRDEIGRAQASVKLDLNLEKGRIREEAKGQDLKIKETETRIEQEVAGLRERVEGVKFSTLQWLVGVCTGAAALILGAWRLLM
ncbi:MAG: hypothetical protein LQ351_007636 [Letrouitia transgressa]|nr:MAG: hypothetical protein LQ351_007636 [Letrouitia transgressa]